MMELLLARMDAITKANHEDLLARMEAKLDANREADREKMEATDLKPNPEEMESEGKHWEVPMEEVAVKRSGKMKKRYLAAGRRGEPKELTQGDCGSWKKLAAVCRKRCPIVQQ
jgi:hypothetical protein